MTNDEGFIEWLNEHRDETSITGYVDETLAHFSFVAGCNWKDAQFKEYLGKKLESVRVEIDKCSKNTVKEYSLVMVREHLEKIINELFGGE